MHAVEASEIGVTEGKYLRHLQCHFGLDSLSLARRGVVTGLDFSPVAIAAAHDLATRAGLPARFVEADVYEAWTCVEGGFDILFVTWGALCWLPDIRRWGRVVAEMLSPGGFLYLADTHPSALVLAEGGRSERDGLSVAPSCRGAGCVRDEHVRH